MSAPGTGVPGIVRVNVPEIRDYVRVNLLVRQALDAGAPRIVLEGVEGQRLLLHALTGAWQAVVEIDGSAGPELAAELDAPRLRVICRGAAADGAGRGLASGHLTILGEAGVAAGYAQRGGLIVASGGTGPRAGLEQQGGVLLVRGLVGALAGERQRGGVLIVPEGVSIPHLGHARWGGLLVRAVL